MSIFCLRQCELKLETTLEKDHLQPVFLLGSDPNSAPRSLESFDFERPLYFNKFWKAFSVSTMQKIKNKIHKNQTPTNLEWNSDKLPIRIKRGPMYM